MICPRRAFEHDSSPASYHLKGCLFVPRRAQGVAVVAWESAWSRGYRARRQLAAGLKGARFGTCEVDLFGPAEASDPAKLNDIELLAGRLQATLDYLGARDDTGRLPLVLVAGDHAAPAAVMVAARRPARLRALVCCAGEVLRAPVDATSIDVPTVLVVPSEHPELVASNEEFFWSLNCVSQLAVVRGAGRRFEEPGTLLACEKIVTQWCQQHLDRQPAERAVPWEAAMSASQN